MGGSPFVLTASTFSLPPGAGELYALTQTHCYAELFDLPQFDTIELLRFFKKSTSLPFSSPHSVPVSQAGGSEARAISGEKGW